MPKVRVDRRVRRRWLLRREKMEFNINEKVRVKLTDHGRAVHADDHAAFWANTRLPLKKCPAYTPPKEDAEGWSEWQLWILMEAFGPHIHMGFPNCFETTIEIVTPNAIVTGSPVGESGGRSGSASD